MFKVSIDLRSPQELYVYNLGFRSLFPKYSVVDFPVTQTIQIELGMMGAVAIMGMAVQARVFIELKAKLHEINAEQEKRNAEVEAKAESRFQEIDQEREQWEMEHGKGTFRPKVDDLEASRTLTPESHRASSQFSLFKSAGIGKGSPSQATPKEEPASSPQLNLDLGQPVAQSIPGDMMTDNLETRLSAEEKSDPDIKKNLDLLNELEGIKKTITAIKSGSDRPSSFATGARPRVASTGIPLSAQNTVGIGPRPQVGSRSIRPTSTPALNEWDDYVKNRSLFQPPSGISQPVTPIGHPTRPHSIAISPAVQAAIETRERQERAYELGGPEAYLEARNSRRESTFFGTQTGAPDSNISEEDIPLARRRRASSGANSLLQQGNRTRPGSQILSLPPKKPSPNHSPDQPVVMTLEELESRHRDKIRALQEPLNRKEAEDAEIATAKQRWERSLAIEREVMTKKGQEKGRGQERQHSRSFGAFNSTERSQRSMSVASKVQDWQKHQDAMQRRHPSQTSMEAAANNGTTGSRSRSALSLPQHGRSHSGPIL